MKVHVGSVVHFVRPDGVHRPGIVVSVSDNEPGLVNMVVFVDGSNDPEVFIDGPGQLVRWAPLVRYAEEHKSWTWHWPEEG